MRVRIARQFAGGIQFVVSADTDEDRVVMGNFERQVGEGAFCLHGFTSTCDGKLLGPTAFNFGTRAPERGPPEGADTGGDYTVPDGFMSALRVVATPGAFMTSVEGCARCGGSHEHLCFWPLDNPPGDCSHWAVCPAKRQPILCLVREVQEPR